MSKSYTGLGYGCKPYDFKDKSRLVSDNVRYMLSRTNQMFSYTGLPDTISKRDLELILQRDGYAIIGMVKDELYAFSGGLGGEPNAYYMPTIAVVSNPALNISVEWKIGEDCVVIPSDTCYIGLNPIFIKYSTLLVENDISLRMLDINSRIMALITAPDDRTRQAGKQFISALERGEYEVIAENQFFDGIRVQPLANTGGNRITDLIEYHQYLKAGVFNEIGLQSNYNMKRAQLNSDEVGLNEEVLMPLVDDMLEKRQEGLKEVNKLFGTSIRVELSSAWVEREYLNSGQPEMEVVNET